LKLKDESDSVAATAPKQHGQWMEPPRYMTAEELAWFAYAQTRTDIFPHLESEQQRINLDTLRFGTRRTLNFSFEFTPSLYISTSLQQHDLTGKAGSISALPDAFRAAVEKRMEEQKKIYANMRPGQSGPTRGSNIPPN
jgi:hypothetical protein